MPTATEHLHTEPLIRLPGRCWCYDPGPDTPPVSPLPAPREGHITFGVTHRLIKVTPQMIRLWSRILYEVPGSKLLALTSAAADHDSPVRRLFAAQGFPIDRLELVQRPARRYFLALHARMDILLDTCPYNGHTTCDALWMGVPVISLSGTGTDKGFHPFATSRPSVKGLSTYYREHCLFNFVSSGRAFHERTASLPPVVFDDATNRPLNTMNRNCPRFADRPDRRAEAGKGDRGRKRGHS
ncbi:MAG TPA: hypothetical protein VLJ39_06225 [Tepidisphaeraceae bacterium]|nr:hypothetical protein [Tepidisphaeraceae bacterium]